MGLKQNGEFGFIEQIAQLFGHLNRKGWEGIGDDCAVIPCRDGQSLVITTDLLVEGTHFLFDKISPEALGYKSLAVNLSDVASMGARPAASFLSLSLSGRTDDAWRRSFLEGYHSLSVAHNVALLGGDTAKSAGQLFISITALGIVPDTNIKRRSGARAGDRIFVTSTLGDAAAGWEIIRRGAPGDEHEKWLADRHNRPKIAVEEGIWLGEQQCVHAMMDVSDGVASDLRHIMRRSSVGAAVHLDKIPLSVQILHVGGKNRWNLPEMAVGKGEDYCLLFTVAESGAEELKSEYLKKFKKEIFEIGRITPLETEGREQKTVSSPVEIVWMENGVPVEFNAEGFTHF